MNRRNLIFGALFAPFAALARKTAPPGTQRPASLTWTSGPNAGRTQGLQDYTARTTFDRGDRLGWVVSWPDGSSRGLTAYRSTKTLHVWIDNGRGDYRCIKSQLPADAEIGMALI